MVIVARVPKTRRGRDVSDEREQTEAAPLSNVELGMVRRAIAHAPDSWLSRVSHDELRRMLATIDHLSAERDALANEKRVWQDMVLPQMRANLRFMEESRDEWREAAADVSARLAATTSERDDLKFSCDQALIEISRLTTNEDGPQCYHYIENGWQDCLHKHPTKPDVWCSLCLDLCASLSEIYPWGETERVADSFRKILEHVAEGFDCTYSIPNKEWTHGERCPDRSTS